ncbi:Gfo/Idh/MocA family protein [Pseudomonas donghuensis]|uniref:Gfo/Idh/MocA family protein n=1 Tax=Pseudomonas donghuensis TaxID=1163398 RepID=UPI000C29DE9D|nr:Gfo/Idh/MocA family oxidoreductase [Pseudomonas donghuensis]PJY93724.1 oxidoreductase [Pseudomonas donghuensis]WKY26293.1 Gfo/Idh/MocA family oxidoreductase [Pseudomonas donghuensis]
MHTIRIAVAGAGLIGRRHIELIQASAECELAALVDPAPAAAELAASHGVALYPSLEQLFAEQRPDAVILATPNHLHVEGALACVEHGIGVLIEKPLAHTLEAGKRLLAIAERTGARLLVGHHRAHSTILAKAREVIAEGLLGNLVAVMGSALFYKPDDYFDAAPWRRQIGGGPVLINMIHEISNLRSLCGEIVAVQAQASSATRGFAVEDSVAISLRFASGALGTFMLSDTAACARSWEQTTGENLDYPSYADEDCYVISGTRGSLSIPSMRLKYYEQRADRSWWKPFNSTVVPLHSADPLARQLAHFCQVIRGHEPPLVSVRDGLRNVQIVEAISSAARSGQIVATDSL